MRGADRASGDGARRTPGCPLSARDPGQGEPRRVAQADRPRPDGARPQRGRPNARALMADSARIEELRAEARYHRERYDLYRAKMYGGRPMTMVRLRELERAHQGAAARFRRAQQERASQPPLTPHSSGPPRDRQPRHTEPGETLRSFSEQSRRWLAGAQPPVSISTQVECRVLTW